MREFNFMVPQNIIFGPGSLNKLPQLMQEGGFKSALILSGPRLLKAGLVARAEKLLQDAGFGAAHFTDIEPNPSANTVEAAAAAFQTAGSDCIIALGGGSPMDVAKAVGVLVCYGGRIQDYEGGGKVPGKITDIIAVPTTAGSGSEVTAFSVITDTERHYKFSVFSYDILPSHVLLDPELITTLPAEVAASTGLDAFIHAMEAYLSRSAMPFTDALAEKAMEKIGQNIRAFVANREDLDAAAEMLVASSFGGMAFAWARLGNIHAMSHPVSAFYGVAHGFANAVLMPYVLEYNELADKGRYARIYRCLTGREAPADFRPAMLTEEVRRLLRDLSVPETLSAFGVDETHLQEMVRDAMASGNILANPRSSRPEDVEAIYRRAIGLR